jgi:xanthine dehydrogenase accessory factor
MATAAARLLHLAGFPVLVLERARPLAVRRLVSFAEAVARGEVAVEGVVARRVAAGDLAAGCGFVPVVVDESGACLAEYAPGVLVDARMAKRSLDTARGQAPLVVGVGPGFVAGRDVDAVGETQRGSELGRVLWEGSAIADTSVPAAVGGHTEDRVLRSPRAGTFLGRVPLASLVAAGDVVGEIDGTPVVAAIAGLVRGLVADGVEVHAGVKLGDIDPRGAAIDASAISDKARAVAAGVLEAVCVGLERS